MVVVSNNKLASWSPFGEPQKPYMYDDQTMTYDSATVGYDWLNPRQNEINEKQPADWEPSGE